MKSLVVLVDDKSDWKPYFPSEDLVCAKDYLFSNDYLKSTPTKVINLCRNFKYLSIGYYSSLLAEARGHKAIPSIKTLNDLSKKRFYLYDLDELNRLADISAQKVTQKVEGIKAISFRMYFGRVKDNVFQDIAGQIFDMYPCPILEVRLIQKKVWSIESIAPISFTDLNENEEEFFGQALERYSTKMWRIPARKKQYIFDLAILVNPNEKLPPSNEAALLKFEKACSKLNIYTERITKKDISRINEFDGLFIRETTSIKNHTYAFSNRAQSEGLVVIDDPESILKCTNKIFMHNLMVKNKLPQLPSRFVSSAGEKIIEELEKEFSYPMVLKIPDGSFSIGVQKVNERDGLRQALTEYLKNSSLVLVQKFFPTDFDWRIGVLNGEAFYACKYYMSKGHWQIYNHQNSLEDSSGDSENLPIDQVPEFILKRALHICSLIGNGLYGVDIKEVNGEAYIVEVNDNPNIDDGVEDIVLGEELYFKLAKSFLDKKEAKTPN